MRIIPAIDIIEGKCVRLTRGDYASKRTYRNDPLEVAREFEAHGIEYLHLVDLDGARSGHIVNQGVLEKIATHTKLKIDFGGGLKQDNDLRIAFECGARQVTGGSIAVKDPDTFLRWVSNYGSDKIILGADAMNEKVAVSGWIEDSGKSLIPFIRSYQEEGIRYVICTDISKDGMLEGPSFSLYERILEETQTNTDVSGKNGVGEREESGIRLIASGGISKFGEIPELSALGCEGVIIGKAIYEDRIKLSELEQYILTG